MNFLKCVFSSWVIGLVLFAVQGASHAVGLAPDSASIEVGVGKNDLVVTRVAVQWDWNRHWFNSNGTSLDGYFDLNAAWWHASDWKGRDENKELGVVGFTPVFRFMKTNKKGPYVEAGIGVSFFSKPYNNAGNNLGISFQFADHVGIGYVFNNNLDLGLRLQHYSNAGISNHNDGENLFLIRAAYRW
ncbi:MAG: acyloxyacyl hydrolase [Betaproteobacteria bacterium]|nr:acyloxyacyl hydrolase [Betaproteobacteria bacterium]